MQKTNERVHAVVRNFSYSCVAENLDNSYSMVVEASGPEELNILAISRPLVNLLNNTQETAFVRTGETDSKGIEYLKTLKSKNSLIRESIFQEISFNYDARHSGSEEIFHVELTENHIHAHFQPIRAKCTSLQSRTFLIEFYQFA